MKVWLGVLFFFNEQDYIVEIVGNKYIDIHLEKLSTLQRVSQFEMNLTSFEQNIFFYHFRS